MKNTLKTLLVAACCFLLPGLFATTASAQTATTRSLTILGGSGVVGNLDTYTEYYDPYAGIWKSAYLTGEHPWGFVTGTNNWINYKASNFTDEGCFDQLNPCKYLYRVRFSVPATWTSPTMALQMKADNSADVRLNNAPLAYIEGEASIDGTQVFTAALTPGINTLTFEIGDFGGYNGFNYRIDMSVVSTQPMTLIPGTPPPPLVDPNTKVLSILGGTGVIGANDMYTEYFNPTTGIWQQAYLVGVHPWGLLPGTSSWLNYRNNLASDDGCIDINNPCKYLYRVRFTAPPTWTNPKMTLQVKVDNTAVVKVNNVLVANSAGEDNTTNADLVFKTALVSGTNTITFEVGDFGTYNGFNYRIDVSVVSTSGTLGLVSGTPPPPPPPPPTIDPNTKYLTILGGTGLPGAADGYAEYYNPYLAAWQPAYLAGIHPWGLLLGTTSWINFRNNLISEDGCIDPLNPCKYLYRIRFTAPPSWTNPKMTLQVKVDNTADVRLNNTPVAYVEGQGNVLNADLAFTSSLLPGTNTITMEVGDFGSYNGFNYRIDLSVVSTSGSLGLIAATPPPVTPPPVTPPTTPKVPTDSYQCKKDGWKLLVRDDGTTFKNQGDCVSYVVQLKVPTMAEQCANDGWKTLNRPTGAVFRNQGDCVSYIESTKPRVPTTSDQCKNYGWSNLSKPDGTRFKSQTECLAYIDSLKPKVPTTEDQCKNNGWAALVRSDGTKFKSQTECTTYVAVIKKVPTDDSQCKNYGWKNLNKPDGTKFKSQSDCMKFIDDCDDDDKWWDNNHSGGHWDSDHDDDKYDRYGYDKDGYDKSGYTRYGYDHSGYDKTGYDKTGHDRYGCDKTGYDKNGYDKNGYSKSGYDRNGYDKYGKARKK